MQALDERKRPRDDAAAELERVRVLPAAFRAERDQLAQAAQKMQEQRDDAQAHNTALAGRLQQLDPGLLAGLSEAELTDFVARLANPGFLRQTGGTAARSDCRLPSPPFGAEQQRLLANELLRTRRVGRTACNPPNHEPSNVLRLVIEYLFAGGMINRSEVDPLLAQRGSHSNVLIFEDWCPWRDTAMVTSWQEYTRAEAAAPPLGAGGRTDWLRTFSGVKAGKTLLSATGAAAACSMLEATGDPALQHVIVDMILAYFVRPGSQDGEHEHPPEHQTLLDSYFGPILFSLLVEDPAYFFILAKSAPVRKALIRWLRRKEQQAHAWELTEEAWFAWAGVSEIEACDSGTTTAWLVYLPARCELPPIQLPALGALTPPKLPARPARGAQLKVVLF